jgi:hypothetical protein
MQMTRVGSRVLSGVLALSLYGSNTVAIQRSREDGERFQRKIDAIAKNAATIPVAARNTPLSEDEVNSYLVYNAKDKLPRGLTNPEIRIGGDGWLSGHVLMDIDEFKRHRTFPGLMDPLAYISGKVPVTARGILRTRAGRGQFQLESAEILGLPLPKSFLQELVAFFSRTPENPNGFDIDAPFNLPAKIREVVINQAEAIVVQ